MLVAKSPFDRAQGEDVGTLRRQGPLDLDLHAVGDPLVQAPEEPTELLDEAHERPDRLGHPARGDVHRVRHEVSRQRQQHLFGDGHARLVLRLGGRGAEVRGDDDRGQPEQRRLGRGLLVEHVEPGPADVALRDGVGQGRLVDDPATGRVHDPGPRLRLGQQVGPDEPDRLGVLGQVHGQEVGLGDQLVEQSHRCAAGRGRRRGPR